MLIFLYKKTFASDLKVFCHFVQGLIIYWYPVSIGLITRGLQLQCGALKTEIKFFLDK